MIYSNSVHLSFEIHDDHRYKRYSYNRQFVEEEDYFSVKNNESIEFISFHRVPVLDDWMESIWKRDI